MLSEQQKRRKHCRAIGRDAGRAMRLALPLIGAQLLHMSNGLVDTLVAGRLGRDELAAGGLGGGIWFFISLGCIGLMAGLSPTLSNMIGASRRAAVGAQFRQGLWFAVVVGCIAFGLVRLCMATLEHWGIDPVLPPLVRQYLSSAGWSLPAFALLMVCRNLYEATGVATPVLIIQVIGVGVNLMCNLAFGLGWWGFPKWGLYGIGLATSAVAVVAC